MPHKAVAEVTTIGHCRRGELLRCMDGRANPLMDRKVAVIFGVAAVVTSPTAAGCSVGSEVPRNCSCSCSRSCSVIVVVV